MKRGDFVTIESIYHQSDACKNGLQLGDTIIEMNNKKIKDLTESEFYEILKSKDEIVFSITRSKKELQISFTPKYIL